MGNLLQKVKGEHVTDTCIYACHHSSSCLLQSSISNPTPAYKTREIPDRDVVSRQSGAARGRGISRDNDDDDDRIAYESQKPNPKHIHITLKPAAAAAQG